MYRRATAFSRLGSGSVQPLGNQPQSLSGVFWIFYICCDDMPRIVSPMLCSLIGRAYRVPEFIVFPKARIERMMAGLFNEMAPAVLV